MMRLRVKRVDTKKPHVAPCKRQEKWRRLFNTDYESLQDKIDLLYDKLEEASQCYTHAKNKEQKKAAFSVIRQNHRILRDMVLAGVIDESCTLLPLLDRLNTLLYFKKH